MVYYYQELPEAFGEYFKDLKNLKVLRIDGVRVSDATLKIISENCPALTEIGLGKCSVTDTGVKQLVSGCVKLNILNLTCCNELSDSSMLGIAESCKDLLCLKLECCNLLSERSLEYLGSCCTKIREIDLTDCSGINDTGKSVRSFCFGLARALNEFRPLKKLFLLLFSRLGISVAYPEIS